MAITDAGLSNLVLSTYSTNTYFSTFFNGSTDSITRAFTSTTDGMYPQGTTYTIEAWVFMTSTTGLQYIYNCNATNTTNFGYVGLSVSSGVPVFDVRATTGGAVQSVTGGTVAVNTWTHIAGVVSAGTARLYVNGVSVGTPITFTAASFTPTGAGIGFTQNGFTTGITRFTGFLSNLRLVQGTAVYTAAFNPPLAQLTAITNTGLLTCNTNSFADSSTNNFTLVPNGSLGFRQSSPLFQVTANSTLSPTFSTGTLNYTFSAPGNVQAITVSPTAVDPALATIRYNSNVVLTSGQANIANAAPIFTSGFSQNYTGGMLNYANALPVNTQGYSWTIELWVNPTGVYTATNTLFTKRVTGLTTTAYEGYLATTSGFIGFYNGTLFTSTFALTANTWNHVAYTYDGTLVTIFVNGTRIYSATVTITDNTEPLTIGGARGYTQWTLGNVSNFRMVKGYVLYTNNFTPPTQPLSFSQSSGTGIRAISHNTSSTGNSVYFNGTNAYMTTSYVTNLYDWWNTDFTIEAWVFPISLTTWGSTAGGVNVSSLIGNSERTSTGSMWSFGPFTNNTVVFTYYNGSTNSQVTGIGRIAEGSWHHIAMTRTSAGIRVWVNGLGTPVTAIVGTPQSAQFAITSLVIGGYNNNYINGYVSNLRIVRGTARYSNNFIPTTLSPLTAVTNTSLLLFQSNVSTDASTNNVTVTNTNAVYTTNASPYHTNQGGSTQFLGTSLALQTLQNSYNPSLALHTNNANFTIECWVYLTGTPPASPGWYLIQKGVGSTPAIEWSFSITSTGLLFQYATGIPTGTTVSTASATCYIVTGQWMHCAVTKVGTTITYWFNGKYAGSINNVVNMFYSASVASYVTIANSQTGATTAFNGFISNVRVVYGIPVYTANNILSFTPSTTALTETQSSTSTTAAIANTGSAFTVANGASVMFNNSNDFLTFPEPTSTNNDVTVEAWVLVSVAPTTRGWIINNSATTTGYFGVAIEAGRTVTVWSDSNVTAVLTSSTLVPLGTWTHIAVTLNNGLIITYINGVRDANTVAKTTTWGASPVGTCFIGRQASAAAQYFPGFISNLRLVYGTAVYTSKFTVPTSPLTAITNTVFLGLRSSVTLDSSSNNATITIGSGATGLYLSPLTSPFTTYHPIVSNGSSIALGWQSGASPTDFLTVNALHNTALQLPGDFTLEAWIHITATPTTAACILDTRSATTNSYVFNIQNSSGLKLDFYWGTGTRLTGTTNLALNTWYHVAATRLNGTLFLWINGIQEASVANVIDFGPRAQTTARVGAGVDPIYFSGYISNIRLIIGTAIYRGTFVPSSSPLGITTSSSTNTLAVTGITSYPLVGNPIGLTYSGSVYFGNAATTTNINTPNAGRYELSTFDFTIEAWFYNTSTTAATYTIVSAGNNNATTNYAWALFLNRTSATAGTIQLQTYTGFTNATSLASTSPSQTINTNQWYHVAVVRIGTALTTYLNGVSINVTTLTTGTVFGEASTATLAIGGLFATTPYVNLFSGYISNVRVIRGYGVYTGTFTPQTSPLTNTQASATNRIALGTETPILGNSVFFNGANDYMRAPGVSASMGTGDFTLEAYIFPTSFAAVSTIFSQYPAATTGIGIWNVQITTGGIITVYYDGSTNFAASTRIFTNEWYHVALVRIGTTITLYVNGVSYGSVTFSGTFGTTALGNQVWIGAQQSAGPTQYFAGYMSNVRFVKGVGVYTGAFTVPTNPLTSTQAGSSGSVSFTSAQTSLLALQSDATTDNSINSFTLTATGTPSATNVVSPFLLSRPLNSAYFNGTASLTIPASSPITDLGTGDFTVDAWFNASRIPTTSSGDDIFAYGSYGNEDQFRIDVFGGNVRFRYSPAGATQGGTTIASGAIVVDTWYHVAMVRISGVVTCYLNGTSLGSVSHTVSYNTTYAIRIGALNAVGSPTNAPSYRLLGYISSVRLVKGVGVYTGTFTVPTTTVGTTQLAGTNITALSGSETVLLTCQDSTFTDKSINNLTITNNDTSAVTSTTSVVPPGLAYYYPPPSNGLGIQFTGSSQYLNAPSNAVFTFGTGDFTIEGWIYLNSATTSGTLYDGRTGASTVSPQIYVSSSVVNYAVGGTSVITGATLNASTWYHVAIVKISGSTKLYVNGSQSGSTYTDSNNYVIGSPFIGTGFGSSNPLNGFISNLRVVKGVGVYTGSFAVATSPLTNSQASGTNAVTGTQTSLLLYQNSPFTDNSTFAYNITPFGNPHFSPVFSPSYFTNPTPLNANSGFFNGTSAFLSLTQPSNAGTGDFTIELWVYPTSLAANSYLLSTSTTTTNCFHLWITTAGAVSLAIDSATATITSATPSLAKVNTWTHIAITRTSGIVYMWINGLQQTTGAGKSTQFGDTGTLNIGRYQPTANLWFTGFITNIRFVYGTDLNGSLAYSSRGVPLTPLTAIANTTLLLLQTTLTKDNSTNNVTVSNTGVILSTFTNPYSMMKYPVLLSAQTSRDYASTTGIRDSSMYNATMTSGSLNTASYMPTVSPYGVTPALLLAQSSLTRDNSINNYSISTNTTPNFMPYVTPFFGDAVAFNGSTSYITGVSPYACLGGDFTIEFFMMAGPQTAAVGALILGRNAAWSSSTNNTWYIMCSSPGGPGSQSKNQLQTIQLHNFQTNQTGPVFVGDTYVCDSKWHHIAIVRISNIVTIYVDGVIDPNTSNRFINTGIWDLSSYTIGSSANDGVSTVAQLAYNGILSNLRIINGVGLYTGNFTPPTEDLTTSQASGTNVVSYTPLVNVANGSSFVYTNVSTSGVTVTNTTGLNFYRNDYTIEFFAFLSTRSSNSTCLFSNYNSYTTGGLAFFAGEASSDITKYQIAFDGGSYPATALVSRTSIIYGRWVHYAITRNNGTVSLYINGIFDSSINNTHSSNPVHSVNNTWYIGYVGSAGATSTFTGYISNFRVVNGVAVYSGTNTSAANFTVPTSPLTLTQSSSANVAAITGSSLATGAGSLEFQTTTTYSTITGNLILNTGANDWTVEAWVNLFRLPTVDTWPTNSTSTMVLFGTGTPSAADGINCIIGQTQLFVQVSDVKYGSATHNMQTGVWYHLAYVRINSIVYFYVNGIQVGSTAVPANGTGSNTYIGSETAQGSVLYGSISNLRVVKGAGVYRSNFDVTTSPLQLTQSSVTNVNAITGTNTSLLTLQSSVADTSTNALTLTTVGVLTVDTTLSPIPIVNGGSGFFNGTTSALSRTASSAYAFGTSDFTVEAWVYLLSSSTSARLATNRQATASLAGTWSFNLSAAGTSISFTEVITGEPGPSASIPSIIGQWTHVAASRISNTTRLFVNGTQVASATQTTNFSSVANSLFICSSPSEGFLNAYVSNFRIVNGVGVYSGNFTVPTSPLTIVQPAGTNINAITSPSSVTLLTLQNSLTGDNSVTNATATIVGSPTFNTTNQAFMPFSVANGRSVIFNGKDGYLTAPSDSVFAFGTGDFTIEAWVYLLSGTTTATIFDNRTSINSVHPVLYINTTVRYATGGVDRIVGSTIATTTWYHIALTRISGVTELYVNGVQSGPTYTDTNNYLIGAPSIGAGFGLSNLLYGNMSNLRVVKGVGVYPGTFTVPSSPLSITQSSQSSTIALTNNADAASVWFSGSTSLVYANSTVPIFQLPGNFTFEAWVWPNAFTTNNACILDTRLSASDTAGIFIGLTNAQTGQWMVASGSLVSIITSSTLLTRQTWQHIAVVRSGSTITAYLNGVSVGTATNSVNFSTGRCYIGQTVDTIYWNGYISNARLVKDIAVYTGAFTVPANPLSKYQTSGTNIAALPAPSTTAITNGNAVSFNGTTDYLVATNIASYQFSNNHAVECWFKTSSLANTQCLISKVSNTANYDFILQLNTNGSFSYFEATTLTTPLVSTTGLIETSTWYHIAVARFFNVYRMFLNGRLIATSSTITTSPGYSASNNLNIGVNGTAYNSGFFNGLITNVRLSSNNTWVYPAAFYPLYAPLTNNSEAFNTSIVASSTVFLGLQTTVTQDNSTNNNTLTATGTPTLVTNDSPFLMPSLGYAALFNGSTQFIETSGGTAISNYVNGTSWTAECWFMIMTDIAVGLFNLGPGAGTTYLGITTNVGRTLSGWMDSATATFTTTATFSLGVWNHVALVKNNTTTTLYLNGASVGSTSTGITSPSTRLFRIGRHSTFFNGYMSNFRFVDNVAVYTGTFTVPTSPLSTTQSSGTNISAITGSDTEFLLLQDNLTIAKGSMSATALQNTGSVTFMTQYLFSPFSMVQYPVSLLTCAGNNTVTLNENGSHRLIPVTASSAFLDRGFGPFVPMVSLLAAQTTKDNDARNAFTTTSSSTLAYHTTSTPFGNANQTVMLTAQTTLTGDQYTGISRTYATTGTVSVTSFNSPFETDAALLTLQNGIVVDYSNNRSAMTVVGSAVSPTDANPFTTPKGFTGVLIPYGYIDVSFANANVSNSANLATSVLTYNPFTIPSSTVSVLGLQTSNLTLESSMYRSTFTTLNTAPTISNTSSPFGTYNSNGIITLTTSSTTGIPGNKTNFANILVTAGDGTTTNAYSINITAVAPTGNLGSTLTIAGENAYSNYSSSIYRLLDVGNIDFAETTANIFTGNTQVAANSFKTTIPTISYDVLSGQVTSTAPSNGTFFITDVQSSNLAETLADIYISNVRTSIDLSERGIWNVAPSNTTFFISDVQNSNIDETLANVYISNVRTSVLADNIIGSSNIRMPSPVGGTVLFPTYSYTDGVEISAVNVSNGTGGGTFVSNQQVWYQS